MIHFNNNEIIEVEDTEEAYDYTNEELFDEELDDEYEERENDYCD